MSYYTPGCGNPPSITCTDCPTLELGRVRSLWLQKVTYTFADITSDVEWENAICSGDVIPFYQCNGSAAQAEQLSDGYSNVPQVLDSYEYTLDLHLPITKENIPFWNFVKKSNQYLVGFKSQTWLQLSSVAATFIPKVPIGADIKSKVDLALTVKFIQSDLCAMVAGPVSIFTECVDC